MLAYPQIITSQTLSEEYNYPVSESSLQEQTGAALPKTAFSEAVLCSCVKLVREFIPSMPYGDADTVFGNTKAFEGSVAIFWFPPSERYPNGTKHVAYVDKIEGDRFYIKQSNKETCKYTEEWVEFSSPYLLGFYNPNLDIIQNL